MPEWRPAVTLVATLVVALTVSVAPNSAVAQVSEGRLNQTFLVATSTHPQVSPGDRCEVEMQHLRVGRCRATVVCNGQTLFEAANNLGYGPCDLRDGYLTFHDDTLNRDDAVVITHEVADPDLHLSLHVWGAEYDIQAYVTVPYDPSLPDDPPPPDQVAEVRPRPRQSALAAALGAAPQGAVLGGLGSGAIGGMSARGVGGLGTTPPLHRSSGEVTGTRPPPAAARRAGCTGFFPRQPTARIRMDHPGDGIRVALRGGAGVQVMVRAGSTWRCGTARRTLAVPAVGRNVQIFVGGSQRGQAVRYSLSVGSRRPRVTARVDEPRRVRGRAPAGQSESLLAAFRFAHRVLAGCGVTPMRASARARPGRARVRVTIQGTGATYAGVGRDAVAQCMAHRMQSLRRRVVTSSTTVVYDVTVRYERRAD